MNKFRKFRNRIVLVSATLTVSTMLVLLQFGLSAVAFGVLLGGSASIAKMWFSASRIMKMGGGESKAVVGANVRAAMMNLVTRYGLIAICLAIGFFIEQINVYAVAGAIFVTNFALIGSEVARNYFPGAIGSFFGNTRTRVGEN